MDISKELELYEKALKDYKWAYTLTKEQLYWERFDKGFCYYFSGKTHSFHRDLTILAAMNPTESKLTYWFKTGELEPRIALLEKAIEICKHKLNETK